MHQLAYYLLPSACVLCCHPTQNTFSLCAYCQQNLPSLSHYCQICGNILPAYPTTSLLGTYRADAKPINQYQETPQLVTCGACLHRPPPYDRTYTLFAYEQPIIKLITGLKFHGQLSYASILGHLLAKKIQSLWYRDQLLPACILPVPLHPLRLRERGFNQALEIARPISKICRIPIDYHGIQRTKHTTPQHRLPATTRYLNIQHAFCKIKNYQGQHIAVLDDVITTGHTITECCKVLKQAGARRIDIWCCAHSYMKK